MNSNDSMKFSEVMMGLADNFGGNVSPEGMDARFNALEPYDISQVIAAGDWLMKHREKTFPAMPMVSEFIKAIDSQTSPQISSKSLAEIQVDQVLENLRHYGSRSLLKVEDPITAFLMSRRWPYQQWASTVLEKNLTWWRKEFIEAYQAYSERDAAVLIALPPGKDMDALKALAMGTTEGESYRK